MPIGAEFKDASGAEVRFGQELPGRPAIILPIFYRCQGVCEVETEDLLQTLPTLDMKIGRDFDVILFSIDPKEGPDLAMDKRKTSLASSPKFKGTEAGWHFLTGDLTQIRQVTDALGFFFKYNPQTDVVNHPSGLMFLTPQGRVSSYILTPGFSKTALETNLRIAAQNSVGQKTDDTFLGCVHTDPVTGRRSINILRFMSIFALVFLCGAVTLLAYLNKASKRLSHDSSTES